MEPFVFQVYEIRSYVQWRERKSFFCKVLDVAVKGLGEKGGCAGPQENSLQAEKGEREVTVSV